MVDIPAIRYVVCLTLHTINHISQLGRGPTSVRRCGRPSQLLIPNKYCALCGSGGSLKEYPHGVIKQGVEQHVAGVTHCV